MICLIYCLLLPQIPLIFLALLDRMEVINSGYKSEKLRIAYTSPKQIKETG